ncbi:MAG: esterase-like activity of phytase family protein [Candidatus Rokubacteria bacterium]|nr:esterase-like activity of phytase family protein [Candidatus Rokubacteria bacterium]
MPTLPLPWLRPRAGDRPPSRSIRRTLSTLVVVSLLALPGPGAEGAELIGYAVLHADTFAAGPPSGAFGRTGERGMPRFPAQPVQGFSAIRPLGGGAFLVLSDNGFGTRKNSPDYLLRIYTIRPDPRTAQGGTGAIAVDYTFVQLRDPDRKVNFLIVNENTADRLLTGADFDPESLVAGRDGTLWVGEEFGPFLLHFDATGRLLAPPIRVPDPRPGKDPAKDFVRSPDNPFLVPPPPGAPNPANLGRSKGFENMTLSPDGTRLYAMLEGPLAGDPADRLLILEFDLATERFTGRSWAYRMTTPGHAVRDMASVSENEFLVIEGDEGHGPKAQYKKIFLIDLGRKDAEGYVAKEEVADLLNIRDPNNLAGFGPKFAFPYWTIEGVAPLDPTSIVVVNDNNYPLAGARRPGVRDSNEFLVLKLDRALNLDPRLAVK